MNWLSHILLSKLNIEYQLGNLLADPLKGVAWNTASQSLIDGISMHKAIDVYTDSHPVISASKSRLGKKGYLKGVVVDVLYDHFLSNSWESYSKLPIDHFIEKFGSGAIYTSNVYPDNAKKFVHRLVKSNQLTTYVTFEGFVETLKRMDKRLSPRIIARETTLSYVSSVENNYEQLRRDFDEFFPELVDFFKQHKLGSESDNCLL
ncbi:MAG: ACP phosphodiesterase [Kangiellaceae bacterium]|nr:ACP phosphodiesterase [Kangiellaceae bacterium]MCW9000581.1 ACP phosphodiesterase [Kangiellaceae bacterium]MCW9017017.1 ACP phosphodiesterase [Kangiellaceae bacterium]